MSEKNGDAAILAELLTLARQKSSTSSKREAPTWTVLLTILGGMAILGGVILQGVVKTQDSQLMLIKAVNARVELANQNLELFRGIVNTWNSEHDQRVLPMNTDQSLGVRSNCEVIRLLHPEANLQDCITPALPGASFH